MITESPVSIALLSFVVALIPAAGVDPQQDGGGVARGGAKLESAGKPPPAAAASALDAVMARTVRIQLTKYTVDEKSGTRSETPTRETIAGFLLDDGARVVTAGEPFADIVAIVVESANGELRRGLGASQDPQSGIGIVTIDPLPVVPLPAAHDTASIAVGDRVMVCGDPASLGLAFTPGTVAATRRTIEVDVMGVPTRRVGLLQLAMSCDAGDRGGPVVTQDGRIGGICLGPFRGEGSGGGGAIAFAVPFADIPNIADTLTEMANSGNAQGKRSTRPWLGVWTMDIHDPVLEAHLGLEEDQGILIQNVFPDSPAAAAGLQRYDVVTHFDGAPLRGTLDLRDRLMAAKDGQVVVLDVVRRGVRSKVDIVLRAAN
jgi:S1-C subfamily serine protease